MGKATEAEGPNREIRAAGGVVWRAARSAAGEPAVEVAVIHRPRYDDWSIPKGKLAPGETDIDAAVREVHEETGCRVKVGRPLGKVRYMKLVGAIARPKIVRYWAMEADGSDFIATREVDELRWLSLDEAANLLTHDHDRDILQRFVRGPIVTGTVLIVRHASAGDRRSWAGDDRRRPLDPRGWEQAERLIRALSHFEVDKIVSADYVRCMQTVQPVAEALGLAITHDESFGEDGYPGHEYEAVNRVRALGEEHETTVICSQGDVIPDLVARLAEEDHIDLPDVDPRKASIWALTFEGPRLFSAEYHPPPRIRNGA